MEEGAGGVAGGGGIEEVEGVAAEAAAEVFPGGRAGGGGGEGGHALGALGGVRGAHGVGEGGEVGGPDGVTREGACPLDGVVVAVVGDSGGRVVRAAGPVEGEAAAQPGAVGLDFEARARAAVPNTEASFSNDGGVLPADPEVELAADAIFAVEQGPGAGAAEAGLFFVGPVAQGNERGDGAVDDKSALAGVAGDVEPAAGEIHAEGGFLRGADVAHDLAGGDGGELRRGFRENEVAGADLGAEGAFEVGVLVILGDGEDGGAEVEEVFAEIDAWVEAAADDDGIDGAEGGEEALFVFVGQGAAALFVKPEHVGGGEADGEVIAEGAGLGEELHVAGVDDVVATRDEDADHGEAEEEEGGRGAGFTVRRGGRRGL